MNTLAKCCSQGLVSYMCYSKVCRLLTTCTHSSSASRPRVWGAVCVKIHFCRTSIFHRRHKFFAAAQNGMFVGIFQLALQALALPFPSCGYDCCAHEQHVRLLEGEREKSP